MRVLILHDALPADARPDEIDTLTQVEAVRSTLLELGTEVESMAFGADLARNGSDIRAARPDVVFNLVESVLGQGRLIHVAPALLEALGVPFTGSGAGAMLLSASKVLAKRVLACSGLPTPAWHTFDSLRAGAQLESRDGRWLVKSVWEHGSLGLEADCVVAPTGPEQLARLIQERAGDLGGEAFAEEYVHGREFNVAVLAGARAPECLPIPEILFANLEPEQPRIVGYRAKWAPDSTEWDDTPRSFAQSPRDERLHARLRELALATFEAFELDGWARIDFRVRPGDEPRVIDVNANPCLSPDAGFAAALEFAGLPYKDAIERIVARGLTRFTNTRRATDVPHPADCR